MLSFCTSFSITMNFRHIEVFFAVMSSGSITSAAKLLNVSQPSVTTTIKHAEKRLGFALFIRESGRLVPTREARVLFDEVSRAHESLEIVRHLAEIWPEKLGNFFDFWQCAAHRSQTLKKML